MRTPEALKRENKGDKEIGEQFSQKEQCSRWTIMRLGSEWFAGVIGNVSPSVKVAVKRLTSVDKHEDLGKRIVLYLVPPSSAALTFGVTLLAGQAAGAAVRVSCATPVLGSLMGCMALCTASAAAAQVSYSLRRYYSLDNSKQEIKFLTRDALLLNALFGVVAYKVLGGSFRNLMPSSVIHPGALGSVSIPARGSKYANEVEQLLIQDLYKRHGCHHCGSRVGESIADHMPPNVVAHGRGWSKTVTATEVNSFLGRLRFTLPFLSAPPKVVQQRLYPQCTDCMKLQSAALRHGKRAPLVLHIKRGLPTAPYFTGFCIGAMGIDDAGVDLEDKSG